MLVLVGRHAMLTAVLAARTHCMPTQVSRAVHMSSLAQRANAVEQCPPGRPPQAKSVGCVMDSIAARCPKQFLNVRYQTDTKLLRLRAAFWRFVGVASACAPQSRVSVEPIAALNMLGAPATAPAPSATAAAEPSSTAHPNFSPEPFAWEDNSDEIESLSSAGGRAGVRNRASSLDGTDIATDLLGSTEVEPYPGSELRLHGLRIGCSLLGFQRSAVPCACWAVPCMWYVPVAHACAWPIWKLFCHHVCCWGLHPP